MRDSVSKRWAVRSQIWERFTDVAIVYYIRYHFFDHGDMSFIQFRREFRSLARPEQAVALRRFFKTGPGQYGEGDRFLGIMVPQTRKMVAVSDDLTIANIKALLASSFHEERLLAALILVRRFRRGDVKQQKEIYDFYLAHQSAINNWDLVDTSTPNIVGEYLEHERDRRRILLNMAKSPRLWTRRMAVLATLSGIQRGRSDDAFAVVRALMADSHDLLHKACGWMLREVGKRCSEAELRAFLDVYASQMPRTMLRYAIERFSAPDRKKYLSSTPRKGM